MKEEDGRKHGNANHPNKTIARQNIKRGFWKRSINCKSQSYHRLLFSHEVGTIRWRRMDKIVQLIQTKTDLSKTSEGHQSDNWLDLLENRNKNDGLAWLRTMEIIQWVKWLENNRNKGKMMTTILMTPVIWDKHHGLATGYQLNPQRWLILSLNELRLTIDKIQEGCLLIFQIISITLTNSRLLD